MLEESLSYLDRAIAQDDDFPVARGLKAENLSLAVINTYQAAPASSADRVRMEQDALANATKALTSDSKVSSAWAARANLHLFRWQWKEAGEDFARATRLGAKDALTLLQFAGFKLVTGNHEEAVAVIRQAIGVDNRNMPTLRYLLGFGLGLLGRHDEQLQAYRDALELNPTSPLFPRAIGGAELRLRHFRESEKAFRDSERLMEGYPGRVLWLPGLAYGYAMLRHR